MPERRRTFGPVVLLGLAAGALCAVAGGKPWVADATGFADPLGRVAEAGEAPLASSLALVLLACWGVLLVTRGTVRRVVAVLGLLAALGVAATVVTGAFTLEQDVLDALAEQPTAGDALAVETTGWFWAAAVGALLSVAATALAVRLVPAWPEMGGRYDAPHAGADGTTRPEDASSVDLWKAMDEGRDPTA